MSKLFEAADRYIKESSWKTLALIKFCLFSMGMLIGVVIPRDKKKKAGVISLRVFIATYAVLMPRFFRIFFKKD